MHASRFAAVLYVLSYYAEKGESKAVTPNGNQTMRYYVFPMTNWEAESIKRQSRQQGGANTGNANNNGELAPAGTAINVANILTGLFREDVRPILSGSTAFIPQGGLRDGVNGILYGLAPALQQVLFGANSNIPSADNTIPTAAPVPRTEPPTSPRPRRRRTTTTEPESTDGITPEDGSEEETESPTETETLTETSSSPPLPPSSSLQPTATSAESDEETEAPAAATNAPAAATPASPQVSEPITQNTVTAVTPESPQAQPQPDSTSSSSQPTSPLASTQQQAVSNSASGTPTVTQLKVVLEDANSIVTANVVSNATGEDKQYIYLVLLPEQFDKLNQLTSMTSTAERPQGEVVTQSLLKQQEVMEQQEEELEEEIIETPTSTLSSTSTTTKKIPTRKFPTKKIPTSATTRANRYKLKNKNETTTTPPLHLHLQYYYKLTSTTTSTTTTTTTQKTTSTDLPGVSGFQNEDDELEN